MLAEQFQRLDLIAQHDLGVHDLTRDRIGTDLEKVAPLRTGNRGEFGQHLGTGERLSQEAFINAGAYRWISLAVKGRDIRVLVARQARGLGPVAFRFSQIEETEPFLLGGESHDDLVS